MNWIDILIVVFVATLIGVLVWWRFIKHKNSACSFCEETHKKDGSRLLKAYHKKYKSAKKCTCR